MIEFDDFSFTYEGEKEPALNNIDLKIKTGQCVVITGLSGCGKTTLLRIINGLCPSVFQGTVKGVFKTDFYQYKNSFAALNSKYVGSVLQNPKSGFLFSNAYDECRYSAKCIGNSKVQIESKLELFKDRYLDLLNHKNILHLSSGEAQTLSVLSSYIKSPHIVVMDEPTANLDITEIEELRNQINELRRKNTTIVIAEHRVGYLEDICDKIYVMKEGYLTNDVGYKVRGGSINFQPHNESCNKYCEEVLQILDLNYSVKDREILKDIFLSIKKNKVTAIVGKNGSGKSTLGKTIAGLAKANKALFSFDNKIIPKSDRIKDSYFCMQDTYHQMVTSSVKEELRLQNRDLKDGEIKDLLDMVDMNGFENKHPSKLSGGQALRLAVLLAYVSNNKIVILDEPTSGLDFKRMKLICALIKKMRDEGRYVILISHDLELLSKVTDEYILLDNGRVIAHRELNNQDDFNEMVSKIKNKGHLKSKDVSRVREENLSKVNPIVNLIVFFTMANAIFFYPTGQSSIYLMGLLTIVLLINKNQKFLFGMAAIYLLLNVLKSFCPLYYQAFIEIFLIRGMVCGYALKNLTANTKLITIIESLEKINLTDYIIIPIISLIRLFPTMMYDASVSYRSLETRKLLKNKNPVATWKLIIVPIVFSLIRSAENLSLGIETKGMVISKKRTLLTEVNFKITDYILTGVYLSVYTFLIIGGIKWITN